MAGIEKLSQQKSYLNMANMLTVLKEKAETHKANRTMT